MRIEPLPAKPDLDRYDRQARKLVTVFRSGDAETMRWIRQRHPRLPGRPNTNDRNGVSDDEIRRTKVTLADARAIVAGAHQFANWLKFAQHIRSLNQKGSAIAQFEAAVDAIISGDGPKLKKLLRENPELIYGRSTREHRATLLHYVGANAVEHYRQKTPRNAVKIAEILLHAGAEVDADLDYGPIRTTYPERSGSTTLGMVATSCHPAATGVQIALLDLLLDHGASVDGLPGCWNPLIAALHNGRGPAAAHLAKRGARLDLEGAAGVGKLDAVKGFFSKDGALKASATKTQMEHGFMWACEYGHARVVDFLLARGMDVTAQPHGETGLHWAAYAGHASIVKRLLRANAPVDVNDKRFDATPLGWALHGWCEQTSGTNKNSYYEIGAQLVRAGAIVRQEWLAPANRNLPTAKKLRSDSRMRAALRISDGVN
jgi:ankyrin repeat protein